MLQRGLKEMNKFHPLPDLSPERTCARFDTGGASKSRISLSDMFSQDHDVHQQVCRGTHT